MGSTPQRRNSNKNGPIEVEKSKVTGQFAKGNKGGPGRPKGSKARMDLFHSLVERACDVQWQMQFIESQKRLALSGDQAAAKRIWEHMGGRAPVVQVNVDGGGVDLESGEIDFLSRAE